MRFRNNRDIRTTHIKSNRMSVIDKVNNLFVLGFLLLTMAACSGSDDDPVTPNPPGESEILFGADLSYVNHIEDKGGVYQIEGSPADPYEIFQQKGTDIIRLRLWHNPQWTKEVYGESGTQLYNDLADVERSIRRAKQEGMDVLLDFHYSDIWADPGQQKVPTAWEGVKQITDLEDSVYNYTLKTLQYLEGKGLLPEYVQIGNEINCGMFFTDAPPGFPQSNACNGQWSNLGKIINAGINAVREVASTSSVNTKVILHVADPKNVEWWFTNIKSQGGVSDFDIVAFSYYPLWHTTVSLNAISENISRFKSTFKKDIWIAETAYPWTTEAKDSYNNQFGSEPALAGFPKTKKGQHDFLVALTKEVEDGGGQALIYWEPAWISVPMKDLWGTGSSWENCAFFDFDGNALEAFDYMK